MCHRVNIFIDLYSNISSQTLTWDIKSKKKCYIQTPFLSYISQYGIQKVLNFVTKLDILMLLEVLKSLQ